MLVIIVKRLLHSRKMPEIQTPQRSRTIILIKNMCRKIQPVLPDHTVLINLQHHTAGPDKQTFMLFLRQFPGLIRCIVDDHFSDLKGMMIHQTVITADHIRPGLFRLF